ncbi:hypothetical protein CVT24_012660 [Panaeolus cyanescens]|uniref:Prolyl 4-hydroxylase alpha subunit domain-containing protein n=1 Tax=Panaeolus cyanescens TaxID=181874 RepID=A0A409W2F8_9AGAR|nr:hypothetical protein CVT24_012660 [Panaeolus cyanescens]
MSSLLSDRAAHQRPDPSTTAPLDWTTTSLSKRYKKHYLKVIDNVFSDEECAALKALAQSDAQYTQAAVHFGLGKNDNYVDTDYRNSDRILRFDFKAAEEIYKRLRPYVEEIAEIRRGGRYEGIIGRPSSVEDGIYKLVGVNERLSFLRYGPGHFFREHCDHLEKLPDGRLGKVTIQIYLGEEGVQGGSTRIFERGNNYLDVLPKKGRRPDPSTVTPLDWSTTPLSNRYDKHYLKVIDNVFTDEECAAIKALAESDAQYTQAALHYGQGKTDHYVNTDYRNSDRILRFDANAAEEIYARLRPYVEDIAEIRRGDKYHGIMAGYWQSNEDAVFRLVGMNERLSFLRYGPGHFFKGHCDFLNKLPDGRLGQVTIQIYLGEDGVQGGATRISGRENVVQPKKGILGNLLDVFGNKEKQQNFLDVAPKKGRVLIFQHRELYHSGEEVTAGLKYTLRSDLMYRPFDE